MTSILRTNVLSTFSCLGDKCEDTCCKGWSMQVDDHTLARYKKDAPELLAAVEPASEAPWIMRKDPSSGYCVKLEGGLCGIHKQYGSDFLGDACHFYPRSTRALGATPLMTATLSCPEITRLALYSKEHLSLTHADIERLPHTMKDYLPQGMSSEDAIAIHSAFLNSCDDAAPVETVFARIANVSRSLEFIPQSSWPQAVPFYLKNADGRLPAPEANINDPFNLLHALCGLIVATQKPPSERLIQTVRDMEQALAVTLDWKNVLIHTNADSLPAYEQLHAKWKESGATRYDDLLKKYLQMQLSLALYPFSGLGETLSQRITMIGVRLATIKLALMSACHIYGEVLPQEIVVRCVQSLSRFLDHLGDSAFSLQIYAETGWDREARMQGLLL